MTDSHQRSLNEMWSRLQEKKRREEEKRNQIAALRKQAEDNQRRREAEAEERRQAQREQRRVEARSKLEEEKESQRQAWLDAGGNEESFERAWPQLEQQHLISKLLTGEERERRADTSHYA
jgi:colicin import membrane protein